MAILEVKNLTKIYGNDENKVVALDHVSFTVEKGEFIAIVGSSGSGKNWVYDNCRDICLWFCHNYVDIYTNEYLKHDECQHRKKKKRICDVHKLN